ncbi:MAG: nucleoid-associated protein [Chloroflexi bacterium]|nr:nucleoid-associated protein [Chloroflexota bacterium]
MGIQLQRFAYHFVDKASNYFSYSENETDISTLNITIVDFLETLTNKLWDAEDSGNTVSGVFNSGVPASRARPLIHAILENPDTILDNSKQLADLLYQVSPTNASRGILVVILSRDTNTDQRYVAIYKIKCEDEKVIKILSGDNLPEITVEEIRNILFKELQKGALIPHPDKLQYDLKVTDLQSAEPRKYFGATFLGCTTKKSDELQIKKLVPELVKFAGDNEIQVKTEKIPAVLAALGRTAGNVTIPIIEKIIESEKLYDDNYSREAFTNYAEQSSHLKNFDVEATKLVSKKNGEPRKMRYVIRDPELSGIVISGPIDAMQKIRTTNGDKVVIQIEIFESDLKIKFD